MTSQPWAVLPSLNGTRKHAIIIGGGLAGTFAAYSLARRSWHVTLIERNREIANEASGNISGVIMPLLADKSDTLGKFYLQGYQYILHHISTLNHPPLWQQCGVLELSADKVSRDIDSLVVPGDNLQKISAKKASEISGIALKSKALFFPEGGWINPRDLCRSNLASYPELITSLLSSEVISLHQHEGSWSVLDKDEKLLAQAPVVIIANAKDALAFEQCNWLPLQSVRGQLTHLPACGLNLRTVLCYKGYITPETGGYHCVGATFDRKGSNLELREQDHHENLTALQQHIKIPTIDYTQLKGRAAYRTATPDRRACVGPVPDKEAFLRDYAELHHGRENTHYPDGSYLRGLYISVGHGSRGLISSPLAGEYLGALINGDALPFGQQIADTLNPARFIIRSLRRGVDLG